MSKKNDHIIFHNRMFDFDITNAISTQDCTGLIPFAPQSQAQLNAYDDILNYSAKDADIYRQAKKQVKSL